MKYLTSWTKEEDVKRDWYLVDLKDVVLGRAASKIAELLMGKNKRSYVENLDCGNYVVVINSEKVKVTGKKETDKKYYSHSGYPGGFKEITMDKMMNKNSNFVIKHAVNNMLPNNKLRDRMLARLFIYKGEEHKQQAQQPVSIKL